MMADGQDTQDAKDLPILSIMVEKFHNLINVKGESHQLTVRVELGEKLIGESDKIETAPSSEREKVEGGEEGAVKSVEEKVVDIHYLVSIPINIEDLLVLDELASRPILVTISDTLQKKEKISKGDDKGRGDEKSRQDDRGSAIGQCTIDLLPTLRGETDRNMTVVIHPTPGSPLEALSVDQCQPTVDLNISVSKPLLTAEQLTKGNIISITAECLYSPPEDWAGASSGFTYVAACPLPLTEEKENVLVYTGGQYKPGPPPDTTQRNRKWPMPAAAQGFAAFIPNQLIEESSVMSETGDFREYDDREHRKQSEREKARVEWYSDRRSYIQPSAVVCLKQKIAQSRYLPVEIFRMQTTTGAQAKKGGAKEDETVPISFHGLAYVDLAPLLYPGVNRVRGAYKVIAYTDAEMTCRAKRSGGVANDAAKLSSAILNRSASLTSIAIPLGGHPPPPPISDVPTTGGKKDDKTAGGKDKKGKRQSRAAGAKEGEQEEVPVNPEGQLYVEAKSYIVIELVLDRPLVEKRSDEEKIHRVSQLIPPRPLIPKRTNTAQKAVEDFHYNVGSIATTLLYEIRDYLGTDGLKGLAEGNFDERRQKLIYHLNTSGKYLAFKEQLKYSVVKIVREKYCRTSTFQDQNELQTFICDLYVYLLDELHCGLNRTLQVEDERPMSNPLTTTSQLKHFAREAEVNGNPELAATYYRERIAREKADPSHWLDFGIFSMSMNDLTTAEECFKECVSIDQSHIQGLMLCGITFSLQCKPELCEAMFEAATAIDPCNILLWTVFGLSYDCMGNSHRSEMALAEATRLSWVEAETAAEAARQLKQQQAEREAAAAALTINGEGKTSPEPTDDNVKKSKTKVEESAPESISQSPPSAVPNRTIYIQAAEYLLEVKAMPLAERALSCHLMDRFGGPTCDYYVAMGRLMLHRQCMEEVEANLSAAIQLYYQNVEAWALMGHMKYLTGDLEGAKTFYLTTLSFMIDTPELHSIYLRLASIHLRNADFQEARSTFLLACKTSPSCVSWLGVGIASYRMGELIEAEQALSEANVLNNMDAEVWAYLCLISLRCGRKDEAEQAYKFTMKLNLQDQCLLDEIHQLQSDVGFGNPSFPRSSTASTSCC